MTSPTGSLSVVLGLWQDRPPQENVRVGELADELGYAELWIGEMATYDAFAVATAIGVTLRDAVISAEGDLDFRGTLGVGKEAPVGFRAIRLRFQLDTDADDEQIAALLRLTERYCVVLQTLRSPPELTAERA